MDVRIKIRNKNMENECNLFLITHRRSNKYAHYSCAVSQYSMQTNKQKHTQFDLNKNDILLKIKYFLFN